MTTMMNNLETKIQNDLKDAMLAKNTIKVEVLRMVKAAIQNEKVNGSYHELTDSDIIKLIQKLSKQHQESIDVYTQAGRTELANKEIEEKVYLDEYLPKMLDNDELTTIIDSLISKTGAKSVKEMGLVMKELSSNYSGQYDGKIASTIIREKLK